MQPDVCNPLDTRRTTAAVAPYHQHESFPAERAQLVEIIRQQKSGAERWKRFSNAKSRICTAPAAYLYSRCDQRQLDATIACQCALARLVTLEVDWSLSEIPIRWSLDVTRSYRLKGNCLNFSWHRFNKVLETFLRDFGPYWHDSITQLLQIYRLHIHDANLLWFTKSQRCSIGLRSGDCGGHLSKVNSLSCSRNQSEMIWTLWQGALSCLN